MTHKQAVKLSGLNPDQIQKLQMYANQTWSYLAYDIMTVVEAEGRSTIPRSDVLELVLDADYMKMATKIDPSLYDSYRKLSYDVQRALILPAFPFARYGM